jgi:hypothetical protein
MTVKWRLLWAMIFLVGCTETIDIDLEEAGSRLVVDGMIVSDQKMHYVRLSESVPFMSDSASPPISGADVVLSDGMRNRNLSEVKGFPGYYVTTTDFVGIPDRVYKLKISGVDLNGDEIAESYTTSSYMPSKASLDSIDLVYDPNWEVWKVILYARDKKASADYYMFRVFQNGVLISDNISEYSVVSDRFFDGSNTNGLWVQSIDGSDDRMGLQDGDVITLQMASITVDYYRFVEGIQRENRRQYPLFSGPPANVAGNVSNNALGFFTAFSAVYISKRFDENAD